MRASIRLAAAVLAFGAATAPAAVANGAATPAKVLHPAVTSAAWFQPDPVCAIALLCGMVKLPAISPYPKGTYHVATEVGRQTASAYLAVHLPKRALAARGGSLTIPLDTSATDGSLNPQAAKVQVCVIYQVLPAAQGAYDGAPSANCLPSAKATYVAKPAPHLVAKLKPFAGKLKGVKGFALLPAQLSPTTAWQIVFTLPTAKAQAAQLPTLSLQVGHPTAASTPAPKPTVTRQHHTTPSDAGSSAGLGSGPVVGPDPTVPPAVKAAPVHNSKPEVATSGGTRAAARFVTVGYQYPELWLLPILALVLVPFTLRALTRDLTRTD